MIHDKQLLRENKQAIREVLLHIWDPIGVSPYPNAADEYRSYEGKVHWLLTHGASDQEIVDYLTLIETEWMGLRERRPEELDSVIVALRALDLQSIET
jgi:hypothetical protein